MPIWSHFPTPSASRPRKTSSQDRERERVRKSVTDFPLSRHWQLLYSKCCNASGLSAIYRLYLSISLYIHPSVSLSFYLQSSISNYPSIRYLWFSIGMCVCRDGVGLTFSPGVNIMQSAPTQLGFGGAFTITSHWTMKPCTGHSYFVPPNQQNIHLLTLKNLN